MPRAPIGRSTRGVTTSLLRVLVFPAQDADLDLRASLGPDGMPVRLSLGR